MNERIGSGAAIFGWHGFGAAVAAYLLTALLAIGLALVGPAERAEAKQAAAESELSAQAEEKVTGNGVEYRVDSGIVTITGYSGDAATLDLSTLNIGVITAIGSNAFEGQSQLASVVLPETLQSIGAYSFQGCTTLRSIDLPENVASVGASAFRNCTALTSVVVRSRELGVSDWANGSHRGWPFENAGTGAGGISATFASTCKAVPANFFNHTEGAPKVTSVTVAPGVAEIGASAFAGCTELASASLSSGLDAIRSSAFDGCVNLPSITLPATLQAIEPYSFQGCTSLGSIDLPENGASVGASAFRNGTALATVVVRG
ncbi:MAG: leucine-rich repeat domain-containing protein, partial [Eggerthellaceae bacterium]|nr:leucine-rich repeat domain-containing protein [Eggerthellaceae bacterium]